ncbi:MAG: hydroxyacylglutathione hydrolase [Gammaproteobacteria bacterium]
MTNLNTFQPPGGLEIFMFPALQDNYCYLVRDPDTGKTGVIDTPEVAAIERALAETGWTLDYILNTHHHWDHAGGNVELKNHTGCTVVGPSIDRDRIPGIDIEVGEGEVFELGNRRAIIYETPGHTSGHICYHFVDDSVAFTGDTLFSMGCGRLFEGSPAQMWTSLQKLLTWPDDTRVYCAHEYTQANARFALSIEPGNGSLVARAAEVDRLRSQHRATIPSTIAVEKATNPFLRPTSPEIRSMLGLDDAGNVAVFAETRRLKDQF